MSNVSDMANTDKILSLYKRDERAAMQELFDVYYEPLLLFCNRLIRDSESAEDIVQECFVHVWRSRRLENFEGELDRFMFQAVRFRAVNYLRDQGRREQLYHKASGERDVPPVFFMEEQAGREIELLYRTINRLPDECRKIFLMACLDDLKYREIAEALKISVNTVKTQMKIALRFLRESLSRETFSSILLFLSVKKL